MGSAAEPPATWAAAIFLGFGFGTALFFHGTDSAWLAPSFLALLAGAVILAWSGLRAGVGLPVNAVTITAALYALYLLATLPLSTAPFISAIFIAIFSILPALFFALLLTPDQRAIRGLVGLVLLCLAVSDIAQDLFLRHTAGLRPHWPLLDPNNMAALMVTGLLPCVTLYLRADSKARRQFWLLLTALFTGALVATQSRGGMLSGAAGLILLFAFAGRWVWHDRAALGRLAAVLLLIPLALQFYGGVVYGSGPLHNFASPAPNSGSDRLALWHAAWQMLSLHSWRGPGLGTFYYYYSRYRQPIDQSDGFFAHNDPLQMGSELGVIAPLLFYAVMAAVLMRTARALRLPSLTPQQRLAIAGTFGTLAASAIHAHLNFNYYLPATMVPLACVLAAWYEQTAVALPDHAAILPPRWRGIAIALVILALWPAQWLARAGFGIYEINRAVDAEGRGDLTAMRAALAHASLVAPASYDRVPQYRMRADALALNTDGGLSPAERAMLYTDGLQAIHRAQSLNTGFADLRAEEARLDALAQDKGIVADGQSKAIALLKTVLRDDPLDLSARTALSDLYQQRGELKQALAVRVDGLHWPRPKGQPDVNFLIATAELAHATGDQDGYQTLLNQAGAEAMGAGLTRPAASSP